MSDELLPPVAADEMRISVEAGDDYQPSERVGAALAELRSTLEAESGDDVDGFYLKYELKNVQVSSYSWHSSTGLFPSRSFSADKDPTGFIDKSSPDLL